MPRDMVRRREWRAEWSKERRAIINEQNRVLRQAIRAFVIQQKMGKACVRCGITDYRVLDFHHRDGTTKTDHLSTADARNWSRKRILEEIAKCELLCANCHRLEHWDEQRSKVEWA